MWSIQNIIGPVVKMERYCPFLVKFIKARWKFTVQPFSQPVKILFIIYILKFKEIYGLNWNTTFLFSESKNSSSWEGKLTGGDHVKHQDYKFIASFRRENVHFCSAYLISNKHALTAAFCLRDFLNETEIPDFDPYTLVAGRLDKDEGSAVFEIEEVFVCPKFHSTSPKPMYALGLIMVNYLEICKIIYYHILNWIEECEKK